MVTRKTRVLSAIAAVLMLVSLFTCFVLPAVAAEGDYVMPTAPADLKAYKDRTPSDTATDYAITDVEDWLAAVKDSNGLKGPLNTDVEQTFEGITLWFTNDIDFGGETRTLDSQKTIFMNYYSSSTAGAVFKGTIQGQGYSIKGLVVDLTLEWITNGNNARTGLICTGSAATIRDLTVDSSCSFKYDCSGYNTGGAATMEFFSGVFMGNGAGGCTFINCHNEASIEFTNSTVGNPKNTGDYKGAASTVAVFGRQQGGVKFINCSNSGAITSYDVARANGLADWVNDVAGTTIYNCFNTGELTTAYTGSNDYTGMVSTSVNTGTSIDNIIVGNSYCVGDSFNSGSRNAVLMEQKGTSLEAGAEATGELAYLLNANYAGNYGRIYYTTEDGKVVQGTAANQTIKIELDNAGEKIVTYVNLDDAGSIDLNALHDVQQPVYEINSADASCATVNEETGELTVTALPADYAINIDLYSDVVDLTDLKAKYEELAAFSAEKQTWYTSETVTGTLAETLAAVKAKIDATEAATEGAYAKGKEVSADLEILNSFEVAEFPAIGAIVEYAEKEGYTVSNAKELEFLSSVKADLTFDQTVYFTADIDVTDWTADTYTDIDGDVNNLIGLKAALDGGKAPSGKAIIKGLYIVGDEDPDTSDQGNSWLGSYAGASIKNLGFENGTSVIKRTNYGSFLMSGTAAAKNSANDTFIMENVSFKNCESISYSKDLLADQLSTGGAKDNRRANLIIGSLGRPVSLDGITVEGCTLMSNTTQGNSAFMIGAQSGYQITASNIWLKDNVIAGMRQYVGQGLLIGEINNTATLTNIGVFNTTYKSSENPTSKNYDQPAAGLIGAYVKASANASVQNLIMFGNGVADVINSHTTQDATKFSTIKDIYTDAASFSDVEFDYTAENTNLEVDAAKVASGEVAYLLNAAGVAQKWAMDGTTPIFASETAKAPIIVTFKALDAKLKDAEAPIAAYTLYTDKDGKLIGLDQALLDSASWNDEAELAEMTFDSDSNVVIGYTTPAHDHQYAYTDNGDGTHDVTCAFSHTDDELGTFTCDYEEKGVAHTTVKKNISSTDGAPAAHMTVDGCKYCDYEQDEADAAECTGTLAEDSEATWDATCGHGGQTTTVCDACDYKNVQLVSQLPHTWGDWTHVEGTDTHSRSCANKADCAVADEVENCVFDNWTVTTEPKVESEGEETGYCVCGNEDTRPIPALTGIVIEPGKAVVGKTLEVAVKLENNTKVAGLELAITYDADLLTLIGAKKGDWDVVFDDEFPAATGKTTVSFNLVSAADMEGDGTIVILEFAVINDEEKTGTLTDIAIDVTEARDGDTNPVGFEGNEAEIEILTALIKGDVNGDLFVNMADAILLLRYYTEKPMSATEYTINGLTITDKLADITDDGDGIDAGEGQIVPEVNINDVLYLLRYLNGWYTDAEFFGE